MLRWRLVLYRSRGRSGGGGRTVTCWSSVQRRIEGARPRRRLYGRRRRGDGHWTPSLRMLLMRLRRERRLREFAVRVLSPHSLCAPIAGTETRARRVPSQIRLPVRVARSSFLVTVILAVELPIFLSLAVVVASTVAVSITVCSPVAVSFAACVLFVGLNGVESHWRSSGTRKDHGRRDIRARVPWRIISITVQLKVGCNAPFEGNGTGTGSGMGMG